MDNEPHSAGAKKDEAGLRGTGDRTKRFNRNCAIEENRRTDRHPGTRHAARSPCAASSAHRGYVVVGNQCPVTVLRPAAEGGTPGRRLTNRVCEGNEIHPGRDDAAPGTATDHPTTEPLPWRAVRMAEPERTGSGGDPVGLSSSVPSTDPWVARGLGRVRCWNREGRRPTLDPVSGRRF